MPGDLSGRKESRIDYLPISTLDMPLARNQGLSTLVLQAEYLILRHRVTAGWRAASPKGPLYFQKHGTASSDVKIDAVVGHRFIARDRMANRLNGTEFHFGRNPLFEDTVVIILKCFGLHLLDA